MILATMEPKVTKPKNKKGPQGYKAITVTISFPQIPPKGHGRLQQKETPKGMYYGYAKKLDKQITSLNKQIEKIKK